MGWRCPNWLTALAGATMQPRLPTPPHRVLPHFAPFSASAQLAHGGLPSQAQAVNHTCVSVCSVRSKETNLGNLVCDILREACHCDAVLLNSGTLRSDVVHKAGKLTNKDLVRTSGFNHLEPSPCSAGLRFVPACTRAYLVWRCELSPLEIYMTLCFALLLHWNVRRSALLLQVSILPMMDESVVLEVNGAQLLQALENGVSQYPALEGRFPQASLRGWHAWPCNLACWAPCKIDSCYTQPAGTGAAQHAHHGKACWCRCNSHSLLMDLKKLVNWP